MTEDAPSYRTFNSLNIHGNKNDQDDNIKTYRVSLPYAQLKRNLICFPRVHCGTIQKKHFPYWKTVVGSCNNCNVTDCDPTIEFPDIGYRIIICKSCNDEQNYNREIIYSIAEGDNFEHEVSDCQEPNLKKLKT